MSITGKRPHGQIGDHPDSPELKRYLSDGLAALRIAPTSGELQRSSPNYTSSPFGGVQRNLSSAFVPENMSRNDVFSSNLNANACVFKLSSLSNRLEERDMGSDSDPAVAVTNPVDSKALVLYREPPRPRRAAALRMSSAPMAVDEENWFVRCPSRHSQKRRLLAMVPYRPTRRRLLLESRATGEETLATPPDIVQAHWEPRAEAELAEDAAAAEVESLMEVDSSLQP